MYRTIFVKNLPEYLNQACARKYGLKTWPKSIQEGPFEGKESIIFIVVLAIINFYMFE